MKSLILIFEIFCEFFSRGDTFLFHCFSYSSDSLNLNERSKMWFMICGVVHKGFFVFKKKLFGKILGSAFTLRKLHKSRGRGLKSFRNENFQRTVFENLSGGKSSSRSDDFLTNLVPDQPEAHFTREIHKKSVVNSTKIIILKANSTPESINFLNFTC